ncbi:MAG: SpvB/TcaC N-terminal domain-containing protein [Gammaproteobacteria bacterium]
MAFAKEIATKPEGEQKPTMPSISLPKGGGALRGIGEKFAANPVTGTGSMTVPIATSPGRSGFGPQLALTYDSGAGNGPFGFGWTLSLPSITRKTDKGLPQYRDAEGSDVFILSGAEDLVPVYRQDPDGTWVAGHPGFQREADGFWVRDPSGRLVVHEDEFDGYRIRRYRPRIEGLFAQIGRWAKLGVPDDVHWRSISKDNILTLYGLDAESRIADPLDATRIFSWLICETRDDKGNAVIYEYKAEDGTGIDLTQAHERNRGDRDDPRRAANRYLKHIHYGNREPLLDDEVKRRAFLTETQIQNADWMFEVVFDYGEHDADAPKPDDAGQWAFRDDPFSSYRAGFEVRTTRLCQRVLMFHHFPDEEGIGNDCLVRSTDFTYSHEQDPEHARNPVYTFLQQVTQSGYKREGTGYLKRSLPPVEFEYTQPIVQDSVEEVDAESLENLPIGLDGAIYQWTDLHGEGIPGILTEQGGAWFYKRNLSPINERLENGSTRVEAKFAPVELVAVKPSLALAGGQAQFMDLAGDGQPDLVVLEGPTPGLYEHDGEEGWQPFRPFTSRLNRDTRDPNLRFVDLDGDGYADLLITEDEALVWHASLAEAGFGPARRVAQAQDEEKGPRVVFADGEQSIYLADLSGDGLTDLVRIRNGEVCYWPNLGYGRFGAKVTMDLAPHFDHPDKFDQQRIRLADIDGTGTSDLIYLHRDGVRIYFNQSGNSWSAPQSPVFPGIDDLATITAVDLLGDGTACLVWASPLPGDARRQMRYVDLMGGQKPHLLVSVKNNLGAETHVQYAPSTKFYLEDKRDGKPWITRLSFPVQVVERVETYDHISRNRFVTRYKYHHGYFDGEEREFHGFGMVEQFDTEEFAALSGSTDFPTGDNIDAASHVPPVHTKTWFHTGAYLDRHHISRQFEGEYYREPGLSDAEFLAQVLPDTNLPPDLTIEEEREACRALKGSMLRQEVYALDGTDSEEHPYTVTEQNFTIQRLQPKEKNRYGVFFTHPCEAINYHYERNPTDPRSTHTLTLEVDKFGNVLRSIEVGYPCADVPERLPEQNETHVTLTLNRFANRDDRPDWRRIGLPVETRTYEVVKPPTASLRFAWEELRDLAEALVPLDQVEPSAAKTIAYEQWDWRKQWNPQAEPGGPANTRLRLIEHVRTLYRPDDFGDAQNDPLALLPLGTVQSLALPGESYQLAFTPGLLAKVFERNGQPLIPNPVGMLGGQGADRGGYVDLDGNGHWWIPAGRVLLSPGGNDSAAQERTYARSRFFLPHRYRDPFGQTTTVTYDAYDLLMVETHDPVGNRVAVGERLPNGDLDPTKPGNDYRVLQPRRVMDPNRNRTEVAFDGLGMVVGTAVMGKPEETLGDSLSGFNADLSQAVILDHLQNPQADPHAILGRATTRLDYDLFAYQRTKDLPDPQPAAVYTLARETHDADLEPGQQTKVQHSFSYSDGFGREIQKKIQAEPEKINGVPGPLRWVGSGWTIFNNKGKPVRQYEPFFSATHRFEFGVQVGVSPILFYDPVERVVATLHPNHTYEKVVFDPWQQMTYDVNDTIKVPANPGDPPFNPKDDPEVGQYFERLPDDEYLPTWYDLRTDPAKALEAWPDSDADNVKRRAAERSAADKASVHTNTRTTAHLDTLGRPFLTVGINRFERKKPDNTFETIEEPPYHTRVELDIEGNQRAVRDAIVQNGDAQGRIVMRYDYDLLGNRIHQASMEAGERWMLNDVTGKPIRAWDSRGHTFRTEYDTLRRPLRSFVTWADPANPNQELLTERLIYGEQHPEDELRNLRGQLYLHLDQAGVVASEAHDFKGNPLRASRRLATEYKQALDWRAVDSDHVALPPDPMDRLNLAALEAALAPRLEADAYSSRTTSDALNRPAMLTTPHTLAMQPSVIQPGYNEANLLGRVEVNLRGATANGQPVWTAFVTNIDYDAKGQRKRIDYRNGVSTFYDYDPLTFRLVHLLTRRDAVVFRDDCPQSPLTDWPGCQVQNLHYAYDPVGNITHIRDDAQQTIYFKNQRVDPSAEYTYDALYRLIEATGREHLGQAGSPTPPDAFNQFHTRLDHPGDGNAMGTYIEQYVYDAVGNILSMQHRGSDPAHPGWTRRYTYNEPSLLEPRKQANRLSSTTVGNGAPETYAHDSHGNMIRMNHLPPMRWDYRDQLQATAQQVVNNGTPETTWYVYDASGQRVRKVTERAVNAFGTLLGRTPSRKEERIYLGGFEIYREYENDGDTVKLERETLHIMDDQQRIALVETRTLDTAGNDPAPPQLIRYQFGNHLGSASLEMDDQAQIISYEEYTPYGSTSYQAVRSQTETPKRYRYTGKERDEESGLYYHGARYYAPWLGRWTAADPSMLLDGINLYLYVSAQPVKRYDPSGLAGKPKSSKPRKPPSHAWRLGERFRRMHFDARAQVGGDVVELLDKPRFVDPETGKTAKLPDEIKPRGKPRIPDFAVQYTNDVRQAVEVSSPEEFAVRPLSMEEAEGVRKPPVTRKQSQLAKDAYAVENQIPLAEKNPVDE